MDPLDDPTPVLVGHGTAHQRHRTTGMRSTPSGSWSRPRGRRCRRAPATRSWPGSTGSAPPRLTHHPDPGRLVADALRRDGRPHGAGPHRRDAADPSCPQACARVQSGESTLALVVGARPGTATSWPSRPASSPTTLQDDAVEPDEVLVPAEDLALPCERGRGGWRAQLLRPSSRASAGCAAVRRRRRTGPSSAPSTPASPEIAVDNPARSRRDARSAAELSEPSDANPYVAFPYTKLMVTTWTVDQAAALLFCTAGTARRLGIPRRAGSTRSSRSSRTTWSR